MLRVTLVVVCAMGLGGCAARSGSWKLQRNGRDLILLPPATVARMSVPLCGSKLKLSPAQALAKRAELQSGEDRGCLQPGTAASVLDAAMQHQAISVRASWDLRYGFSRSAGYYDLWPGWRIRVLAMLSKSGRYTLPESEAKTAGGNTLEIRTGEDFLGYETSYYLVERRSKEPGIAVRLISVEARIGDKQEQRSKPVVPVFEQPPVMRYTRLAFLTRISRADHDMAILSAAARADLDEFMPRFEFDPKAACATGGAVRCSWVPAGVAVTAQTRVTVNGAERWVALDSSVGELAGDRRSSRIQVQRAWRKKLVPVEAGGDDIRDLVLIGGEVITLPPR